MDVADSFDQFIAVISNKLVVAEAASIDYAQSFGHLFQQAATWLVPEIVKLRRWLDYGEIPRVIPQFKQMYDRHVRPTLELLVPQASAHSASRMGCESPEQLGAANKAMKSSARPSGSDDDEPPRQIQRLANMQSLSQHPLLLTAPSSAAPSSASSSVASNDQNGSESQAMNDVNLPGRAPSKMIAKRRGHTPSKSLFPDSINVAAELQRYKDFIEKQGKHLQSIVQPHLVIELVSDAERTSQYQKRLEKLVQEYSVCQLNADVASATLIG